MNKGTGNSESPSLNGTQTLLEKEKDMKKLDVLAAVLLVVGGLNWGLVGILNFDLVATIFGNSSFLSNTVYAVVGLCALYQVMSWKAIQRRWAYAAQVA